jgi:glycoprotein-N-acetylgalactosamine 3-beta-galactosyltransferase
MTWGKRCDKTVYMTGKLNETQLVEVKLLNLNIVQLNVTENYKKLTDKTIATLLHANEHFIDDFDWLLKADDDTYVIVENLRYLLSYNCKNQMNTFGYLFSPLKPFRKNGYLINSPFNSGGAGYAISKHAVKLFSNEYQNNDKYCREVSGAEDVDIAECLKAIGVKPGDSRDQLGTQRFHPLAIEKMWSLTGPFTNFTRYNSKYPIKTVIFYYLLFICYSFQQSLKLIPLLF